MRRKTIHKLELIATWILIILLVVLTINDCRGQMTIPLVQGTVTSGDMYEIGNRGEPFELIQSKMDASTTEVTILFKRKKHEKVNQLMYPIDSIDISYSEIDETEIITLWPDKNSKRNNPEKIEIVSDGEFYRMYIYYERPILFFTGKVL